MIARIQSRALIRLHGMELGKEFHAECKYPGVLDEELLTTFIYGHVDSGTGAMWIEYSETCPVGLIFGVLTIDPINGMEMAIEMFWYVRKNRNAHGKDLLRHFEVWARERGAQRLIVGHKPYAVAPVSQLLNRRGYQQMEVYYHKLCQ